MEKMGLEMSNRIETSFQRKTKTIRDQVVLLDKCVLLPDYIEDPTVSCSLKQVDSSMEHVKKGYRRAAPILKI